MEIISLPNKYEIKKIGPNNVEVIIEPFFPGYGTTVGNSLRRVILSSLPGSAITAIKIKGTTHEFSSLPGIKEDLVEIILNIKRIRVKLNGTDETTATLKVKGEKTIRAKDIKTTSELEIVTPEAEIATLTEKNSELEIEFTINNGRGYIPVENIEKKKFQLGTIAIDAIYNPVKNVNYRTENVRVGQMTNYDRLIISISTDGSISPDDAIKSASKLLYEHFEKLLTFNNTEKEVAPPKAKVEKKEIVTSESVGSKQVSDNITSDEIKPVIKEKRKRGRPRKISI